MMPVDDCSVPSIDGDVVTKSYRRFLPLLLLPVATMPLVLYWLHKRRCYAYLTLTLSLFSLLAGYLMLRSRGNPWHVLLWFEMLFGFLYLPFALWGWINHRTGTALLVPVRLGAWPVMLLVVLAGALQILFMMLWIEQSDRVKRWLDMFDMFFNHIFLLHDPIRLAPYVASAGLLAALLLTVTLLNLTRVWWKRRALCNRNPTPWWMLLMVLLILLLALWHVDLQCGSCVIGHIVNL